MNEYSKSDFSFYHYKILFMIIFLAILSDFLDGYLARILNEETILGRYLDPVCDKLVTTTALFCIYFFYTFPLWIICVHIFRELIGVWLGTFLFYRRGRIQAKPNLYGKLAVNYISFLMLYYISLSQIVKFFPNAILFEQSEILGYGLILIIFLGALISFSDYRKILFNLV